MSTKTKTPVYDESSIKRLRGLEGIRHRPTMYLGERGDMMVYQGAKEIWDNCADEFLAGRNKFIFVHVDNKTGTYTIADKAQGIPTGTVLTDPDNPKSKKISLLTAIFTEIHTGGKFDNSAYKVSRGVHGVGAAATNAISSSFKVWTNRDGKWYHQTFKHGKVATDITNTAPDKAVRALLPYAPKSGTIVQFIPDYAIVNEAKGKQAKLDMTYAASRLKDLATLNPGLEIVLSCNGKSKTYLNKDLKTIIDQELKKFEVEAIGRPFIFHTQTLTAVLQWTTYDEDDGFSTFVSSGITEDGGEHEVGMRNAIHKSISKYKKAKDSFTATELLSGLLGVFDYKMSGAEYSGQTKSKLVSRVAPEVEAALLPELDKFFAKNKALARQIIKRTLDLKKAKEEFKRDAKAISEGKKKGKGINLAGILVSCPRCNPAKRELFILEGDSAGGCFIGSTPVLLADGTTLTFEEMATRSALGEQFKGLAFNLETKEQVEILFDEPRLTKYTSELIEVCLSDGTTWYCTPDHPWLSSAGIYKPAEDLKPGDTLQSLARSTNN